MNKDHTVRLLAVQGAGRTDVHAGRVCAIQAGDRDIRSLPQRDDLDLCASGIPDLVVMKRADQLA
ncbi:MAG: hypothetical protein C0390_05505 [Syntrophus sp. (in: bacteria)]|nr:hypothetical protein [Syntrophus sp. (in: bacteria)]